MANVTIEFNSTDPLVVLIKVREKHETDPPGGDISVSKEQPFKGGPKTHSMKMDERLAGLDLSREWRARLVQGKGVPQNPHFIEDKHPPAVIHPGETVVFKCVRPFKIWVQRESNVVPDLSSPENPFGWTLTREAEKVGNDFIVTGTATYGIRAQRFYKCIAWVDIDDETVLVDPDVIGD